MDKYLHLIVNRFESYITFLDHFESTNEAATFINESFIYNEMNRVDHLLKHNKNLINNKRRDYELYFVELFHIYHNTKSSQHQFETMLFSLKNAIKALKETSHHHLQNQL
ncbi:hypothetical protein AXY37_12450 [Mammaliicoccus lentus]|jgi:hypothetical protein|uniref:Uncharacterized protein n=1 Tax=Mammaliicoccus lentus TaxID=42858 RepID=A0AAX3W7L9_MAMLE|nr:MULTISPECIES: hypothetical protein [Mammaliicoccus]HBV04614.1 hypothetical protein [Staphylococcus sp.]HIS17529.1 hypothetical protein [Candidatus Coprovivens excrementavium]MBF0749677.1 hypothetical protein [Mammaliicoccus lentus]MBF0793011.1 hypothetical protein [Mammaliicoccus lentus]MBW0761130.1 hypothetical protein [Mammaliicoccus lentus]